MAKSEQRQRGIAKFEEVMGFRPPEIDDPFLDMTVDHLFPNVWGRGELTRRERRLITLTIVTCLGHEPTLTLHLNAATNSGDLSDKDIDEFMLHIAHYAGWPVAAMGTGVARQLRAQR
jgi:4-carboxymuconolactone decarboxylase